MRYKNLNKSGNLATRLNRAMPANTNFPEDGVRNKMATGFETGTKFKLSEAQTMSGQQPPGGTQDEKQPATGTQASVMSFSGGTKATSATGHPMTWDPRRKPNTAAYLGRRAPGSSEDYENVVRSQTEGRSTDLNANEIDTYVGGGGAGIENY